MPPEEDTTQNDERTANECMEIANSISPMIKWTCDFPSAHHDGKLPVLDLAVWCQQLEKTVKIKYEFYRKDMANKVSVPANSALSNSRYKVWVLTQ